MPDYDGSIVIDSHIDTSNFDKDASNMFSRLKKISTKLDDALKLNNPLKEIGNNMKFSKELANASDPLKRLSSELERSRISSAKLKSSFSGMGSVISNTFSGIGSMFTNTFAGIGKMFAIITRRTQWILLGQTIRAVIADAKESIADLRIYNQDFDKSMQSIRDSFKNVGNAIATSFAPIIQALAPIIANLSRWLTELFNKITLFTTALFTGSKTAVIADVNFSGYSKSTKKAAANTKKGTKAIKEQTKALAKFDKLDVFKKDKAKSTPSGIADATTEIPQAMKMFKTVAVPKGVFEFANKLKETFSPLANEFKIIGDSFQKNFAEPVYKHVKENILPRFLESTGNFLKNLNFDPLNNALSRLFKILGEITKDLFSGLEWGWEHILLPMAGWTAEKLLPAFVEALASALNLLRTAYIALEPSLKELWEILKEMAKWTGEQIISALKTLSGLFDKLSEYIDSDKESFNEFATKLAEAAVSWYTAKGIITAMTTLQTLFKTLPALIASVNWELILIAMAIYIIVDAIREVAKVFNKQTEQMGEDLKRFRALLGPAANTPLGKQMSVDYLKTLQQQRAKEYYKSGLWSKERHNPLAAPFIRGLRGFASGTVVSPNRRFLAMLGDNTSEAEVVSPVSTMKQAFMEAMYETGMNTNNGNVVLQLDGTTFARLINPYTKSEQNRIGISMVEGVAY